MSPRFLAKAYASDERLFSGRFFAQGPVRPASGDRVGVILLVPGAPERKEDVRDYLYHRLMLPPGAQSVARLWLRHVQSRLSARMLYRQVISEYSSIGGGLSINRLNREQSRELERRLNGRTDLPAGVRFSVYVASPFGSPDMARAAQAMAADGVTHVVLLPMFPQYATETSGRALATWEALTKTGAIAARPTVSVGPFATREKYLKALNERIEQALQRFPKHIRPGVELLFAAHGIPAGHDPHNRDPYSCLVHNTVDAIMHARRRDRAFSLSFVRSGRWGDTVSQDLQDRVRGMAKDGTRAVLVVPVDHVTEQFDTAYLLDVHMRAVAEKAGIPHYHVVSGLNCHPLFVECLADLVGEQVSGAASDYRTLPAGDGAVRPGTSVLMPVAVCPRASHEGADGPGGTTETFCHACPVSAAHG